VQEELTMRIIARTKNYPALLVQHGHVHIEENDLSRTIGSVFLEKSELNFQALLFPLALLGSCLSMQSCSTHNLPHNAAACISLLKVC
jgi:hypothetical protein